MAKDPLNQPLPDLLVVTSRALVALRELSEVREGLAALALDVCALEADLARLEAEGWPARRAHQAAEGDLAVAYEHARADAEAVLAWSRDLQKRLTLAAMQDGNSTAEARARLRPLLRMKSVRIRGALAELRRVVPELRASWPKLACRLGEPDLLQQGEALLDRLEGHHAALMRHTSTAARTSAAVDLLRTRTSRDLRTLRRAWNMVASTSGGEVPSAEAAWVYR